MIKRSVITKKHREKMKDEGKCIYCGGELPENDWRVGCKTCRDINNLRMKAHRAIRRINECSDDGT